MKSYGIGIVNESWDDNDREHKWLFHFGAYDWTRVLVTGVCDLDDALEAAAGWLADHAPGHLMTWDSEEYRDLVREACEEHGTTLEAFKGDELDDSLRDEILQSAEADLTYTESGFLTSYEWTVCEAPDREYILRLQDRN